jgi:hypothetical protein
MLAAIGWDRIVGKTPNDVLVKVLDVFAQKVQLTAKEKSDAAEIPIEERPSTRITPVPPAAMEAAESAILNAVVGNLRSVPVPPAPASPVVESKPPTAAELDALFSDAKLSIGGDDQIVVVEEDLDATTNDNPTSRPPSAPDAEPMLLKSRAPMPSSPAIPPAIRRR